MFTVAMGNPFDGICLHGLFATSEEANEWGGQHIKNHDWWVADILQRASEWALHEDAVKMRGALREIEATVGCADRGGMGFGMALAQIKGIAFDAIHDQDTAEQPTDGN